MYMSGQIKNCLILTFPFQDDLAIGAVHSPVLLDHPVYETYDYASDWDYYSDDYYDDDPSVVRKHKKAGTSDDKERSMAEKPKKKRKLMPTEDIPDMELGEVEDNEMVSSDNFKGVVWRNSNHNARKGELYEPGQGDAVALIKNWRELFKSSQPRSDRRTQGIEASKKSRKRGKDKVTKENIYDADGDETLGDEMPQTFTPPPCSLSTSDEPARRSNTRPGSKLNNVMSISDEPSSRKQVATTLQSQPISPSSDLPPHQGEFLSHVEIRSRKSSTPSSTSEAPRPAAAKRKRKASTSSFDDEEEGTTTVGSTNTSTTRSSSKRLATRRKLDSEGDTATKVTRTSPSSRGRPRGRPRGRGRGNKS